MTDETLTEPTAPCLTCEVLSVDAADGSAKVRFLNPDHAGGPLTMKTRLVPNPAYIEGGDKPAALEETYEVDEDPNPHVVKTVRVPLTGAGQVDQEAWMQRLIEQARGVHARMTTPLPPADPATLEGLLGPVG
ncbi:hypothetical protein D3C86_878770 [compost metagenome]